MILLAVYIAVGALYHLKRKTGPPRFGRSPEAPDYSGEPTEVQQALSHKAWHHWKGIPIPCDMCQTYDEKAQAAQRWHEYGRVRTP